MSDCPNCDESVPAEAAFCRHCGTELSGGDGPEVSDAGAVQPDDEAPPQEADGPGSTGGPDDHHRSSTDDGSPPTSDGDPGPDGRPRGGGHRDTGRYPGPQGHHPQSGGRRLLLKIGAVVAAVGVGGFLLLDDDGSQPSGGGATELGNQIDDSVPQATFDASFDGGSATVVHNGGDHIDASNLVLIVVAEATRSRRWNDLAGDGEVGAGDSATIDVRDGERGGSLQIVWRGEDDNSHLLEEFDVPE